MTKVLQQTIDWQDGRVGYGARLRFTLILISWFGKLSVGSSPTPVTISFFLVPVEPHFFIFFVVEETTNIIVAR
jgi:hypothetical protein